MSLFVSFCSVHPAPEEREWEQFRARYLRLKDNSKGFAVLFLCACECENLFSIRVFGEQRNEPSQFPCCEKEAERRREAACVTITASASCVIVSWQWILMPQSSPLLLRPTRYVAPRSVAPPLCPARFTLQAEVTGWQTFCALNR